MEFMKILDLLPGDKFIIIDGPLFDDFPSKYKNKVLTISNIYHSHSMPYCFGITIVEHIDQYNYIGFKENEEKYIKIISLSEDN